MPLKLNSTGVQGLDEMLRGGFPDARIVLVCGGPGTGKTILSAQYLARAVAAGEPSVYATFEEPLRNIKENMRAFGWDLDAWEKRGLLKTFDIVSEAEVGFVSMKDRERGEVDFSTDAILDAARKMNARHIVLDPLTSLISHEARSGRKRFIIGELFGDLRRTGCSAILTSETSPQAGDFYMEQFLADGVIHLNKDIRDYTLVKTIRLEKMRGIEYDEQPRRYAINSRGFQVMSRESVIV